ncbi:UNVERIFIED_CONTAM: hypothetical protein FKN15_014356 [Acipenser sinensis]
MEQRGVQSPDIPRYDTLHSAPWNSVGYRAQDIPRYDTLRSAPWNSVGYRAQTFPGTTHCTQHRGTAWGTDPRHSQVRHTALSTVEQRGVQTPDIPRYDTLRSAPWNSVGYRPQTFPGTTHCAQHRGTAWGTDPRHSQVRHTALSTVEQRGVQTPDIPRYDTLRSAPWNSVGYRPQTFPGTTHCAQHRGTAWGTDPRHSQVRHTALSTVEQRGVQTPDIPRYDTLRSAPWNSVGYRPQTFPGTTHCAQHRGTAWGTDPRHSQVRHTALSTVEQRGVQSPDIPRYETLHSAPWNSVGYRAQTFRGTTHCTQHHGTVWGTEPRHSQSTGSFLVELERASRGFGFSLRGGKEYNMGLFILRLAEEGPALIDGRIHVGDQIVEINGEPTQGITHTRAIELIQAGGNKVQLLLRPGQGLVPDYIHMDPMNVSPASFPKEVTSSEEPPPFSPSFNSTSTPESTPTARQEDASVGQLNKPVSGETSPTSTDKKGQNITNNRLAIKTNEKRERSASPRNPDARNELQVKKKESNVSRSGRSASPRKANRERSDMNKERSPSPRKTEKNTAELKDRSVSPKKGERKDYSEATKERKSRTKEQPNVARTRSSSPRKAHKEEHAEENKEMLNSGDDRQRITSSGKADKHGHSKESSDRWEHPTRREDGLKNKTASNTEEKPPVGKRKNHEEKVASPTKAQEQRREASEELEKDGKPQRSRSPDRRRKERPAREKANKETQEPTTLSQKQLGIRDGEVKRQDWEHKKDMGHAGGSENNATSGGRKAPITPGPWKVPSSVKVGAEKQEKHT